MKNELLNIIFTTLLLINVAFGATLNSAWLSDIENNFFGVDYPKDSDIKRIQRIEKMLYGSEQKGSVEIRLKKISQDTGSVRKQPEKKVANELNMPVAPTQKKIAEEYVPEDSSVDYPIVDKLEKKVFNTTYNKENIYKRLDRLEKKVFNSTSNAVLNSRVERLFDALLDDGVITQSNDSGYMPYPSQLQKNTEAYNKYSQNPSGIYSDDNLSVLIASIERSNLHSTYTNDSIGKRLNRLESSMLGKTYQNDTPNTRVERLMAVNAAQSSSAIYDNNKTMRNVATFSQIGGIILMILAMIL